MACKKLKANKHKEFRLLQYVPKINEVFNAN